MKSTRMKPLDAVWLMMESADTPMHVGVLAIFQKPTNASRNYLRQLAQQLRDSRELAAPWNYRLPGKGGASLSPRLVEAQDFDLDYHFRHSALPEPGGERELGVMVSRLHSHALDRSRPLWEFHLIEGLERNRFAFYVKVHHALVDNVNGIPMLLSVLSESASQRNMLPLWERSLPTGERSDEDDLHDKDGRGGLSGPAWPIASLGKAASGLLRNTFRRSRSMNLSSARLSCTISRATSRSSGVLNGIGRFSSSSSGISSSKVPQVSLCCGCCLRNLRNAIQSRIVA